jgi:hypothetical protein
MYTCVYGCGKSKKQYYNHAKLHTPTLPWKKKEENGFYATKGG